MQNDNTARAIHGRYRGIGDGAPALARAGAAS
jgi:hypothetical protein